MEKGKLLEYIAPCALLCYSCPSYGKGPVSEAARKLYRYWQGYDVFRGMYLPENQREAWYKEFATFTGTLQFLGGASCPGCRNNPPSEKDGWGCVDGCVIPACAKEHGVDFCAECSEFPCEKAETFFVSTNHCCTGEEWKKRTLEMRKVGAETYFEENKEVSHYIGLQKGSESSEK